MERTRFRIAVLVVIGAVVALSCAPTVSRAQVRGKMIWLGQSPDKVEEALGAPDQVGSGIYGCRYVNYWGVMPSPRTSEWVYIEEDQATILYFDIGGLRMIGKLPASKVSRK